MSAGIIRVGAVAGVIGLLGLGAAATQVLAAPPEASDVVVRYAAQELSTQRGAEKLYERITLAATRVCPQGDAMDIAATQITRHCLNEVIARTVSTLHSPQLAAVYAARRWGRSPA
jgi:UrcA family protein